MLEPLALNEHGNRGPRSLPLTRLHLTHFQTSSHDSVFLSLPPRSQVWPRHLALDFVPPKPQAQPFITFLSNCVFHASMIVILVMAYPTLRVQDGIYHLHALLHRPFKLRSGTRRPHR